MTNEQQVFSLIDAEDKFIFNDESKSFEKRRQGLYPSEASVVYMDGQRRIVLGKCHRASYYRINEIEKTNPSGIKLYQTGRIGKQLEIMQVNLWKEMGLWVANNVKFFNKELVLSGELDTILRNPLNNKLIGIEMKTYADYPNQREILGLKKEKETGRFVPGRPKENHFLQAILYAWEYLDTFDEYRIYYMDRASGVRSTFNVGFQKRSDGKHQCYWQQVPGKYWNAFQDGPVLQPYTIEDIHDRYRLLIKTLRAKQIPPKDYQLEFDADTVEYLYQKGEIAKTKYDRWAKNPNAKSNKIGSWQCSYCDYKEQCIVDGD